MIYLLNNITLFNVYTRGVRSSYDHPHLEGSKQLSMQVRIYVGVFLIFLRAKKRNNQYICSKLLTIELSNIEKFFKRAIKTFRQTSVKSDKPSMYLQCIVRVFRRFSLSFLLHHVLNSIECFYLPRTETPSHWDNIYNFFYQGYRYMNNNRLKIDILVLFKIIYLYLYTI